MARTIAAKFEVSVDGAYKSTLKEIQNGLFTMGESVLNLMAVKQRGQKSKNHVD